MLRYREDLGLLPPLRDRPSGRGQAHRQFTDEDMAAITTALRIEQQYDITPAALECPAWVLTERPRGRGRIWAVAPATCRRVPGPAAPSTSRRNAPSAPSAGASDRTRLGRRLATAAEAAR